MSAYGARSEIVHTTCYENRNMFALVLLPLPPPHRKQPLTSLLILFIYTFTPLNEQGHVAIWTSVLGVIS